MEIIMVLDHGTSTVIRPISGENAFDLARAALSEPENMGVDLSFESCTGELLWFFSGLLVDGVPFER